MSRDPSATERLLIAAADVIAEQYEDQTQAVAMYAVLLAILDLGVEPKWAAEVLERAKDLYLAVRPSFQQHRADGMQQRVMHAYNQLSARAIEGGLAAERIQELSREAVRRTAGRVSKDALAHAMRQGGTPRAEC